MCIPVPGIGWVEYEEVDTKRLIIPEVSSTEPGTPVIEILELCWSNVWKLKIIFSILLWAFTDIVSFALKPLIFFALSF